MMPGRILNPISRFLHNLWQQVDRWVLVFVLIVGTTLAILSVLRYASYNAGMLDLGNVSQAISSVMRGRPLEFSYKLGSYSRLAFHVELFFFLLAPLYALLPSPATLLTFQAFWFVIGAFPLFVLARRKLENVLAARLVTLVYLLYPVALTAILFDVHGDTLAMSPLLFMLEALDRREWRSYGVWLVLALSCKFYIAAPIVVMGAILYLKGDRRLGGLTVLTGMVWGLLAFLAVRPLFSPQDVVEVQATAGGYFAFYFGRIRDVLRPQDLTRRLMTALIVFAPALWVARHALLWLLPACVIALPSLVSVGAVSTYDYRFHHYAAAVPFLLNAIVEGAAALRRRQREAVSSRRYGRPWRWEVGMTLGITLLFTIILIDTPLSPWFWIAAPGWGLDDRAYGRTARDALKDAWLREFVPEEAPVVTSMYLAPHLVNRETLHLFIYPDGPDLRTLDQRLSQAEYAIADALSDYTVPAPEVLGEQTGIPPIAAVAGVAHQPPSVGTVLHDAAAIRYLLTAPEYGLVAAQDGLLLFQRDALPGARLEQTLTLHTSDLSALPSFDFGNGVGLADVQIALAADRRYGLSFRWVALEDLQKLPSMFAVSRLEGVAQARMVHLPTQVLSPTTTWPKGSIVDEFFEVQLPKTILPGQYSLWVGWYDVRHLDADATDVRSRVGDELSVAVLEVR